MLEGKANSVDLPNEDKNSFAASDLGQNVVVGEYPEPDTKSGKQSGEEDGHKSDEIVNIVTDRGLTSQEAL